jgi:hypothetical protein
MLSSLEEAMLSVDQLSSRVAQVVSGDLTFGGFEDWFREESHNVHLWGDQHLNDAVDSIEQVFSEYHFEGLRGSALNKELANAVRPFVRSKQVNWTLHGVPLIEASFGTPLRPGKSSSSRFEIVPAQAA